MKVFFTLFLIASPNLFAQNHVPIECYHDDFDKTKLIIKIDGITDDSYPISDNYPGGEVAVKTFGNAYLFKNNRKTRNLGPVYSYYDNRAVEGYIKTAENILVVTSTDNPKGPQSLKDVDFQNGFLELKQAYDFSVNQRNGKELKFRGYLSLINPPEASLTLYNCY
ncbi:MAG: hypothetical protein QE271_09970 [Bacteriovoracaceae bacterium]|nr:hypothetical protein [Bacteriovoracaceae bacterium]